MFAAFLLTGVHAITKGCEFEGEICNGHGKCNEKFDICQCDPGYLLSDRGCYPSGCVMMGTFKVCSDHGKCVDKGEFFTCECDEGFYSLQTECVSESCMESPEKGICNHSGQCTEADDGSFFCDCGKYSKGTFCTECTEYSQMLDGYNTCTPNECISEHNGEKYVCNGRGNCLVDTVPFCFCDFEMISVGAQCASMECLSSFLPLEVCSGNGACFDEKCDCDKDHEGTTCQYKKIECTEKGTHYLEGQCVTDACVFDGHACNGHGTCQGKSCVCDDGFVLIGFAQCVPEKCIISGTVCPHGECVVNRRGAHCECNAGYTMYGTTCYPDSCVSGQTLHNGPVLCSDNGECDMDGRKCVCDWLFKGTHCQKCSGNAVEINGECIADSCVSEGPEGPEVCSGNGKCLQYGNADDYAYLCRCKMGFRPMNSNECVPEACVNPEEDGMGTVCSAHGQCVEEACKCEKGWKGEYCEEKK